MKNFVMTQLVTVWPISTAQVEVSLSVYANTFTLITNFDSTSVIELVSVINSSVNRIEKQMPNIERYVFINFLKLKLTYSLQPV